MVRMRGGLPESVCRFWSSLRCSGGAALLVKERGSRSPGEIRTVCRELFFTFLCLGILSIVASPSFSGGGPRNVLVLANSNSPESIEIARYYQQKRAIPPQNMCFIRCSPEERIFGDEFEKDVLSPLKLRLAQLPEIDYIVMTKGTPLRVFIPTTTLSANSPADSPLELAGGTKGWPESGSAVVTHLSVPYSVSYVGKDETRLGTISCVHAQSFNAGDAVRGPYADPSGDYSSASILACVRHPDLIASAVAPYPNGTRSIINPYGPLASAEERWGWRAAPVEYWHHDIVPGYTFYLVTRLDGFTVQDVKRLIDDSVAADSTGIFVLDKRTGATGGYYTANERLGVGLGSAYNKLTSEGLPAMCDTTSQFVYNMSELKGYFSWSRNDPDYSLAKYKSNRFLPGSIADSYYSYSAETFNEPKNPQRTNPLMADLIPLGLCGGAGYVSEPYISTATYPNILFERYTAGYNLAESFYAACPMLIWKTVVFGDPLMAPFATPPFVEIQDKELPLTGLATVRAEAQDDSGILKVEFYLDGRLIKTDYEAPYDVQIDTTQLTVADHKLEVIAYESSPVRAQGYDAASMQVVNEISNLENISQALVYTDEKPQKVRLTSKVVIAGTDQIGGSFYLEELDRSSGIRVVTPGVVKEKYKVSVTGTISTQNGERVIINPTVTLEAIGQPTPAPVGVRTADIGAGQVNYDLPGSWMPVGLRTIGLLVKAVGLVTESGNDCFYIDDGSGAYDGIGPAGVRVIARGTPPARGKFVSVVGVSSCDQVSGRIVPVLRMRKPTDLQVLR